MGVWVAAAVFRKPYPNPALRSLTRSGTRNYTGDVHFDRRDGSSGARMRYFKQALTFSATDLVNFLGCRHATYLDVLDLADPAPPIPAEPFVELLKTKGLAHEQHYVTWLRAQGREVVDLASADSDFDRIVRTREAMAAGADVIYQGALRGDRWQGYADFLTRVPGESTLGTFHYEPIDTKLASVAKPKHALQLAVYSRLLAGEQGRMPHEMHIVVGDGSLISVRAADLHHYSEVARTGLESFCAALPNSSVGEPCSHCASCRWNSRCEKEWQESDHLSLVAGITRSQRDKLQNAGVTTMADLAQSSLGERINGLQPEVLKRIRGQAKLQVAKRTDGKDHCEVLDAVTGKGFARMPRPDAGDLFFDMEGDPLFAGGLEYLFGIVDTVAATPRFTAFWGHDRIEEKAAFERAVDFIGAQLTRFPAAHVYHYASYEESALKRLAMLHGTRENAVDHLLRTGKLVDLYQVVRESIRVSERSYSIKNVETFYMPARSGGVKDAGASVVMYEQWRQSGDPTLLQEIANYNEVDCISTWRLRNWLLTLRPPDIPWYQCGLTDEGDAEKEAKRRDAEQRSVDVQDRLRRAPESEQAFREMLGHLLEFHRREAKPAWWAMFQRQAMSEDELIEDGECMGGLRHDPTAPPYPVKRSVVHTFRFPPQDFKLRVGDRPKRADTLKDAGEIVFLDENAGQIALKIGSKADPPAPAFSLIPGGPMDTAVQREAIYRYAEAVIDDCGDYAAVRSILMRDPPRVTGLRGGQAIIGGGADVVRGASAAIARLQDSHMLVQGPPGTGKTYLSAHTIVDLLTHRKRIGVASNSHKAINNLLMEVERQALERGVVFRGAKKCSTEDDYLKGGMIEDVDKNEDISEGHYDLIGGTAWLFARPEFDQTLDYLFIDEAGQVSLANVIAMGLSARNIVLVGDQMQLSQPAQGVHPGDSGKSALDFLLGGIPTVPPARGIFLPVTRRMHPDVCRFVSEAFYEGRLMPETDNANQRLLLDDRADVALRPSGITFAPVTDAGCGQKSKEEGARIARLFASLLTQRWIDRRGVEAYVGPQDILVVSPYNIQVNHLKSVLPAGARVGTVDKFQGQEAAVVLVSMTTSTAEEISRGMDFLYSRNRLNVAISRAKCLAVIIANPKLLAASCNTIDQLRLVNALCFVKAYGEAAR
ncbi:MAG: hypothetical protein JWN43_3213 [Gammaproteobacteria bacterium]|nr:hypothetical protein [Gammaproteobacteria bacterium]